MSYILTLKFVYFSISLYRGFLFKEIDLVQKWPRPLSLLNEWF